MITRILHALTDVSVSRRGKFVVIALWLVVAIGLNRLTPNLARLYDNNANQRIPSTADSQVAQRLLLKEFPQSNGTPAIIVFHNSGGLNVADRVRMHQFSDWLLSAKKPSSVRNVLSAFTVPQAASELFSQDGTTTTMVTILSGSTTSQAFLRGVQAIRHYARDLTTQTSLEAYVTGPAGIITDLTNVFSSVDVAVLLTTIGLVFVLLIVLYRSPVLALLPLLAVGVANMAIQGLLSLSAVAGLSIAQMSASIATVLLFGAGTDYSIFIASRFREELQHTPDKHRAMQQTMRAVGEAITSSAGTVILAMCTLLLAAQGLYTSLGPSLAITIIVMLLAGLTLVPALIVWPGRAAYWPFVPHYRAERPESSLPTALPGFWGRLGLWTVRHRVLAVVGSTLLLAVLALGNIGSQPSLNALKAFRIASDSTRGYALLQQHFSAGILAPTTVLIQLHGATPDAYQHLAQIDAVTVALQKFPGVATVQGPTRPTGKAPVIDPAVLQTNIVTLPTNLREAIRGGKQFTACTGPSCSPLTPQIAATIGAYAASSQDVSPDNTTIQFSLTFKDDPYSLDAINRIAPLRNAIRRALDVNRLGQDAATSATFHLAGQTALQADTLGYNQRDMALIVPIVLVLVFLVLALLLRSLIAPLYLLVAVTLNFLAATGACGFLFQCIQGQDGFYYAVPLYTFIFLVALGADYTIFLMSRVREEVHRRGIETGVPVAVARTGGVITSAGVILAGTFLVLTSLPLTLLYQLGVCVAVGILLDTFVVRSLLVPGLVLLLGKWNWWPGHIEPMQEVTQEPDQSSQPSLTGATGQE